MKRSLCSRQLKQTLLAVPAAALMLGAAQAGNTVGINYTADWMPFAYDYLTTGFNVTAKAFGVEAAAWANTTPLSYGLTVSNTMITGSLTVISTANNAWSSGIGNTNPDPNGPATVTPGDDQVTWGYLDDAEQGYSVNVSGLNAEFPNGYVVQTISAPHSPPAPDVNVTDSATYTNVLTYTDLGNGAAISSASPVMNQDHINLIGLPSSDTHRSVLAGFILTDQPVVTHCAPAATVVGPGGSFVLASTAIGIGNLSYQWQHAGTNLPGATFATCTNSAVEVTAAGAYQVIVTSDLFPSLTATGAVLTVTVPVMLVGSSFAGGDLTLTWTMGSLQSATNLPGPWFDVSDAVSPLVIHPATNGPSSQFYRLRQ
jgi:hypothetical protein